jgi:phosphate transport system substrate-binding protein
MKLLSTLALATAFVLSAANAFAADNMVKADGSSTVFPITEAVAEEFGKVSGGIKAMVGISGTGGGFKRFCRGETDVSNASRPIKEKELIACKETGVDFIELEVAYDGLTVVVNPDNKFVDYLTVEELKKIWEPSAQGVITKWSQIRQGWPDEDIKLFGPGTDSGTFDYFTEVINGKAQASRGDYTASEDDNVLVEGVSSEKGGLGYFGLAYYEQNMDKLRAVPIVAKGASTPVTPSVDTVRDGSYKPLSRPLFIYVSKQALSQKPAIEKFVAFYLDHAAELSKEVGYIPLPDAKYAEVKSRFTGKVTGSKYTK